MEGFLEAPGWLSEPESMDVDFGGDAGHGFAGTGREGPVFGEGVQPWVTGAGAGPWVGDAGVVPGGLEEEPAVAGGTFVVGREVFT